MTRVAAAPSPRSAQRPAQEKKGKAPIGPLMIGFFLFVVVGSSVLQIVQMAGMGGRIAQQMENQQPRAEPQPRQRKEEADARGGPLLPDPEAGDRSRREAGHKHGADGDTCPARRALAAT